MDKYCAICKYCKIEIDYKEEELRYLCKKNEYEEVRGTHGCEAFKSKRDKEVINANSN